jgi:cellulose synthase/poly-beta-1,6-N-acetylglucosamine synthase-like glycosyltransferase
MIIEVIFWISIFLILHSYLFYPLLLTILSISKKNNQLFYLPEDELPFVSVIISAFNEEEVIREKIESVFNSSYPGDKFEVLVGSDASDDQTIPILEELRPTYGPLRVYDFKERRGKGNVVNDLVNDAKGSILILTDANVYFDHGTIYEMVKHFKNPDIGLVDTNMINRGMKKEGISYEERAYISREVVIKNREGRIWGAMMGPFGGCYSIRKEDFEKVPSNYLVDDFYINMKVFEKGKLAINDLNSKVYEETPDNLAIEFRRKIRIGTGNWQNLRTFRGLLFKKRYGFPFWSHKVIRWIGPFLLIFALVSSFILGFSSERYLVLFSLLALTLFVPVIDSIMRRLNLHFRPFRLITHFYSMNLALLIGFFRSWKKIHSGIWERTARK